MVPSAYNNVSLHNIKKELDSLLLCFSKYLVSWWRWQPGGADVSAVLSSEENDTARLKIDQKIRRGNQIV